MSRFIKLVLQVGMYTNSGVRREGPASGFRRWVPRNIVARGYGKFAGRR